jgi:hypothetical protein
MTVWPERSDLVKLRTHQRSDLVRFLTDTLPPAPGPHLPGEPKASPKTVSWSQGRPGSLTLLCSYTVLWRIHCFIKTRVLSVEMLLGQIIWVGLLMGLHRGWSNVTAPQFPYSVESLTVCSPLRPHNVVARIWRMFSVRCTVHTKAE